MHYGKKINEPDVKIEKVKKETKLITDLYDIVREIDFRLSIGLDGLTSWISEALKIPLNDSKMGEDGKKRKSKKMPEGVGPSTAIVLYSLLGQERIGGQFGQIP